MANLGPANEIVEVWLSEKSLPSVRGNLFAIHECVLR